MVREERGSGIRCSGADQSAASADQSALRGTVAEVAMITKSFLDNRLERREGLGMEIALRMMVRWHGPSMELSRLQVSSPTVGLGE